MMTSEEIQSELKRNGISQRELVDRSGLSESIVSTLIKQMPILLPHLVDVLGENPYLIDEHSEGKEMAKILESLANSKRERSISNPEEWQREIRRDRILPGREED
jgi:transcriptional regulator with XRE-family HTH domain